MAPKIGQRSIWDLIRRQHGVITRMQLLARGITDDGIRHRLACGRLRRVYPGVYAVGQLELTQEGRWMAAILACGEGAALSHDSAAALWRLAKRPPEPIHVSVLSRSRSRNGIEVHRRQALVAVSRDGIPTTTPAQTLIDIAASPDIEQAIGEAVLRRLISLEALRTAATKAGRSGAPLRHVIHRATYRVTQSELERAFLRRIADTALPLPESQPRLGDSRV